MVVDWDQYCPHPSVTIVIGDIDSGKTVSACAILDHLHKLKNKCAVVAEKAVAEIYQETAPWISHIDPSKTLHPKDTAILLDDAHLYAYARTWWGELNQNIDIMARESRHTGNSYIYTTQQAAALDANLVRMVSCVIIKEPSLMQIEGGERPMIRKRMEAAAKRFKEEKVSHDENQKNAYVLSRKRRAPVFVRGITQPKWFTQRISKAYRYSKIRRRKPINLKRIFRL